MSALDRYFFGPVAAARPYLLVKGCFLLLAFDCFIDLAPHGGRYGVGDFNVAHFAILDAVQPLPTPAVYVGTILACGVLALALAFAARNRVVLGVLAALYTWSWAMSQLDSYQHHYLLSIVLLAFVFYPATTARELVREEPEAAPKSTPEKKTSDTSRQKRRKKQRRGEMPARDAGPYRGGGPEQPTLHGFAWAYHATAVSFAIVYAYTAISKTEEDWRTGHALQRIAPEGIEPFRAFFVDDHGFSPDTFFWLVGHSVVLLQVVISAGYFAAPLLDRGVRWARALCLAAFVGATSFHVGAEYLGLEIGWFSYYMLVAAFVFFLPTGAVAAFARAVTWPYRMALTALAGTEAPPALAQLLPLALGAALVIGLAGYSADLPGAFAVGVVAAVALLLATIFASSPARLAAARTWIAASTLAALAMWASVAATDVRYEYYRFVGGDMRRRGDLEASLEAYVKANMYAPEDENRHRQEDDVRRRLGLPARWNE